MFGSTWLRNETAAIPRRGNQETNMLQMVKRRHKRRRLVDRFKDVLCIPAVLRVAFWILRIVDILMRARDWLS